MKPTRIILGSLVIALALGGAVWVHAPSTLLGSGTGCHWSDRDLRLLAQGGRSTCSALKSYSYDTHTHWQTPLAVFVAIAGLGLGEAIIVSRPRRASPSS